MPIKSLFSLLVLMGCFIVSTPLAAQTNTHFENLQIHHDKPFYVTGETVWFSIYFTGAQAANSPSQIVHTTWHNANGLEVARQQWKRSGQQAAGQFFIPLDWQAGLYTLRYYTHWNCNDSGYNGHTVSIPIYNTNPEKDAARSAAKASIALPESSTNNVYQLNITPTKSSYTRQEKVTLDIALQDAKGTMQAGTVSIAVVDSAWIPAAYFPKTSRNTPINRSLQARRFPAETTPTFRATILHPDTKAPMNSNFMLLHEIRSNDHFPAKTKAGELYIELPEYEGVKQMQLLNLDPYLPAAPLVERIVPTFKTPKITTPLPYDSLIYTYQQMTRKARKIDEFFAQQQATMSTILPDSLPTLAANISYNTADYENLDDLYEFIDEVLLMARVKGKKDKRSIRLYDEERNVHYPNAPIYYVNGWLVGNEQEVLKIPLSQIERVEVFNEKATLLEQQFPRFMAGMGVIAVYTKKNRVPTSLKNTFSRLTYEGLSIPQTMPTKTNPITAHQPDFRPLVYWQSSVSIAADKATTISFLPTAGVGTYWVLVKGLSADGMWIERAVAVYIRS